MTPQAAFRDFVSQNRIPEAVASDEMFKLVQSGKMSPKTGDGKSLTDWSEIAKDCIYFPVAQCHSVIETRGGFRAKSSARQFRDGDVIFFEDDETFGYRNNGVELVKKSQNGPNGSWLRMPLMHDEIDDYGTLPTWVSVVDDKYPPYYYGVESAAKDIAPDGMIAHNCYIPFCRVQGHEDIIADLKYESRESSTPASHRVYEIDGVCYGIIINGESQFDDQPFENMHIAGEAEDATLYLARIPGGSFFKKETMTVEDLENTDVFPFSIVHKSFLNTGSDFLSDPDVIALRAKGVSYTNILKLNDL
jgi:hypothetical protein